MEEAGCFYLVLSEQLLDRWAWQHSPIPSPFSITPLLFLLSYSITLTPHSSDSLLIHLSRYSWLSLSPSPLPSPVSLFLHQSHSISISHPSSITPTPSLLVSLFLYQFQTFPRVALSLHQSLFSLFSLTAPPSHSLSTSVIPPTAGSGFPHHSSSITLNS